MLKLIVLISGRGSNLQAIIEHIAKGALNAKIALVISNEPNAFGLDLAKKAHIPTQVCSHKKLSRTDFEKALIAAIEPHKPDYIVLAGFMRILSPLFVSHFSGKILNIHPSLLPAYTGLRTHARALADQAPLHGCSVHFVDASLDGGPLIAQSSLRVDASDTEESLADRVIKLEHKLYSKVLGWLEKGDLCYHPPQPVLYQGHPIPPSGIPLENLD